MSAFSECFMEIKDRRNLTGVEIAEMCNKETSVIFHWLNGTRFPKNWKQIEGIVVKLKLSDNEYQSLKTAYEKTALGKTEYECHRKIIEIFDILQKRRDEYLSFPEDAFVSIREVRLPEFVKMNNKMEIISWVQNLLDYLSAQEVKKVYLKFQTIHQEILMLIKMFCSRTKDSKIEAMVYLLEDEQFSGAHNLEVLKGIIEILVQRNSVEIYCQEEANYEQGFGENWIISEDFAIQYNDDLSTGMLSTNPEWIQFMKQSFDTLKENSGNLGKKACDVTEFNEGYEIPDMQGFSIEHMPCIGNCLTKELLERNIYPEIPHREEIIQGILAGHFIEEKNEDFKWRSFFFKDGLIDFMNTGRIENFPYMIYQQISLADRCEILQNGINICEDGRFSYHMVKDGELPSMRNLYIEQMICSMNKLEIYMHFEAGLKEQFQIKNESLKKEFQKFFEYLEKGGYVYSRKETLTYMKKVLREYRKKLENKEE